MTTQPAISEHWSPELAQLFLEGLPQPIRQGLEMRAKAMNYPVWAVIEMAILPSGNADAKAGYLDDEALSFVDCKPNLD